MTLRLAIQSGPDSGQQFPLDHDVLTIGTTDLNDVIIADQRASRRHAELRLVEGQWLVADLGSLAGTYVNGERIAFPRALRPGDLISLGGTTLALEHDEPAPPPAEPLPLYTQEVEAMRPMVGSSWRPETDQRGSDSHRHDRLFATATAATPLAVEDVAPNDDLACEPVADPPAASGAAAPPVLEQAAAPAALAATAPRGLEETIELSHRLLREAWHGEFERLAGEKDELETRVFALGAELQQMSDQLTEIKAHLDQVLRELVTRRR